MEMYFLPTDAKRWCSWTGVRHTHTSTDRLTVDALHDCRRKTAQVLNHSNRCFASSASCAIGTRTAYTHTAHTLLTCTAQDADGLRRSERIKWARDEWHTRLYSEYQFGWVPFRCQSASYPPTRVRVKHPPCATRCIWMETTVAQFRTHANGLAFDF